MLERVQLHLVRRRTLAGEDTLTLQIAVYHENHRLIVCQVSYDNRNLFEPCQFTGVKPTMTGDHLIAAVRSRPHDGGIENAELLNTVYRLLHQLIVHHAKGMPLKGMDFGNRYLSDFLRLSGFVFFLWHVYTSA